MVLHFLLVNEYLKATFFLILWKFIFETKRVTINTWAGVYLITWKHCRFQTFYKQKICNNRLTRNTQLPILHFLIVADTNYCSHFVEMFTVQFFYLKCYNQSCITHYAIYSNNYLSDKVLFKNKKDSKKVSSSNKKSYNLREIALTFQQNGVIMVRRL